MEFIDLEDGHPERKGTYSVKVKTVAGHRESKAEWKPEKGFILINDNLSPEEYIYEWKKNN